MKFYLDSFTKKIEQTYINIVKKDLELEEFKNDLLKLDGKKIRSSLHFLFANILGYKGEDWKDVGAVLEMVHTASLFHDDVLDEAKLRRGKTSFNQKWGDKNAILMGDFLLACALKHLSSLNHPSLILSFSKAIQQLSISEILQSRYIKNPKIKFQDYLSIIKGKTGSLFATATYTAFLLTGLPQKDSEKFYNIGLDFGMFFQIRDDYLDYFSDFEKSGKSVLRDFSNGLYTYPIFILMESSTKEEIKQIHSLIQKDPKDESDTQTIFALMKKYTVQAKIKKELETMLARIVSFFDDFPNSAEKKIIIEQVQKLDF